MLKILFVILIFPFLVSSYRYGTTEATSSVWQKCSRPSILHGDMNCEINWGGGYYPIQTADCKATCEDGYMLIGMALDILFLIGHFHTP